ncbi:MAG: prolipoprotein diacylglyceryl transferase family protein [Anaerolineales bacterium]
MWNATRHPTQIYELIASLIIFALIWYRKSETIPRRDLPQFRRASPLARLFLEVFRGDSTPILGGISAGAFLAGG